MRREQSLGVKTKLLQLAVPPPPIPDKGLRKDQEEIEKKKKKKKAILALTVYDKEIDICLKHFYPITMQIISLTKEKIM